MQKILLKCAVGLESRSPGHPRIFATAIPCADNASWLFGIMDVRGIDGDVERVLAEFAEQIERTAGTIGAESQLQHRFEQIVQGMNERLAILASEPDWNIRADEVHALIGLAGNSTVYLTGTGDLTALFLHHEGSERYKVFNLFRGIQTENHAATWEKLFSIVLDGDLHAGDAFLAGNRELPQQMESEELNRLLSSLPPSSAVEKIRQYFPAPTDLALLILRAEAGESAPAREVTGAAPSLDHFDRTARTTSRLLEHQRPRLQDWPGIASKAIRVITALVGSVFAVGLAILFGLIKNVISVSRMLGSSDRKRAWGSWKATIIHPLVSSVIRFRFQPNGNKRAIAAIALSVLILIGGLAGLRLQRNRVRDNATFKTLVGEIEDKRDTAQASLIYKDENQARQLLADGLKLVATIDTATKERTERATQLRGDLETILDGLRHAKAVETLTLLASMPTGEEAAALAIDKTTSYAFTKTGGVYRYDAGLASFVAVTVAPLPNFVPIRVRFDDLNNRIYLFDGRQIARFDPEAPTYEIVPLAEMNKSAKDMEYYARRVYILSDTDEQIYRHERTTDGFGGPSGWLQARTVSIADATSFSIDGSVWLLKGNGQILRYQNGMEESWPNPAIDPPLPVSTILWTSDLTKNLYLIDRDGGGRIIVLNKEQGSLIVQWTHEAFKDIRGMWEKDKQLQVLTGTGLYTFPLE